MRATRDQLGVHTTKGVIHLHLLVSLIIIIIIIIFHHDLFVLISLKFLRVCTKRQAILYQAYHTTDEFFL